jgi:hypothetical protein
MMFKGVYRDGVVVLEDATGLRNGQPVDVVASRTARKGAGGRKVKPSARKQKADAFLALAGLWKGRPEWKGMSSVEIAAELRRRAMGERHGRRAGR